MGAVVIDKVTEAERKLSGLCPECGGDKNIPYVNQTSGFTNLNDLRAKLYKMENPKSIICINCTVKNKNWNKRESTLK